MNIRFNVHGFVDEGGYPYDLNGPDLTSITNAFRFCRAAFGLVTDGQTLFNDFVVCHVTLASGELHSMGGLDGVDEIRFDDSYRIGSYRCFIDANRDGKPILERRYGFRGGEC